MELPDSLISSYITRGTILHSTMFKDIDHGKYFVIIGINKDYVAGFFFINSNINIHLENKPEQFSMQYPIKKSDYNFLHYDSFLCATNVEKIPLDSLRKSMKKGTTTFIGKMMQKHVEEVLNAARNSRLFSKQIKKQFFY